VPDSNFSKVFTFAISTLAAACGGEVTDHRSASGSAGAGASASTGGGAASCEDGTLPPCTEADGLYSAVNLATAIPRFVLMKAAPARDLCFRLTVEPGYGGQTLGIDSSGEWRIARGVVTDHADECTLKYGYPPPAEGHEADAVSGEGTMTVNGPQPCEVSLHATVSFEPQEAWAPKSEAFDFDALMVEGGCF
jgi:hypothetical protein